MCQYSDRHDIQLTLTEKASLIIKKLPAIDPATRRWMCPEIPICLLSSCKGDIISISRGKQRSTVPPIKTRFKNVKNVTVFHFNCGKIITAKRF